MTVLIPLEGTDLGFHPSFPRHDRDQAACLCSFGLTQTFDLCILTPPSTENIRCAGIPQSGALKKKETGAHIIMLLGLLTHALRSYKEYKRILRILRNYLLELIFRKKKLM